MFTGLKAVLASKKFWITILGSVIVTALSQFGVDGDALVLVGSLFGLNVAAQGAADFGKAKP